MHAISLVILTAGIALGILGFFLLRNPRPQYMPKLSYRVLMKGMSEEGATEFTRFYGAAALGVGICLLIIAVLS